VLSLRKRCRLVLVGFLLLGLVFCLANPLRWPEPAVHAWLLWKVPTGSTEKELYKGASTAGWRVNSAWPGHQPRSDWGGIDGATVVWVYLGNYRTILRTDLDSFWAFDERGRLVDVRIR
jgi:hypothetical protein